MDKIFNTEFLNQYMDMVEDTESPRIYHIWTALWAAGASLGRRCWLPFGIGEIFPNQYVLLIGSPAARKSTALSIGRKVVKASTGVRFAPADTGGQRQGLVLAMQGSEEDHEKLFLDNVELGARANSLMDLSLDQIAQITDTPEDEQALEVALADKHHLAAVATEFSRFIGQNNLSMLDFLVERWDGEDYEYKTRQSNIVLKNTLMNMIAATTPTSLNNSLPPSSGGQGFLSRMILVYGAQKYKTVPTPMAPPADIVSHVKATLNDIYHYASGPFNESAGARAFREGLYDYRLDITDSRFAYYAERRYTHLIKLAMCLGATRVRPGSDKLDVTQGDYEEAHRILKATEVGMTDALGEFGMNPTALLKQEILEQLRAIQGPLTMNQITAMFHRDASSTNIAEVIRDLHTIGQIKIHGSTTGQQKISAVYSKQDTEDAMRKLLAQKE